MPFLSDLSKKPEYLRARKFRPPRGQAPAVSFLGRSDGVIFNTNMSFKSVAKNWIDWRKSLKSKGTALLQKSNQSNLFKKLAGSPSTCLRAEVGGTARARADSGFLKRLDENWY